MARCCGPSCACKLQEGPGVEITGTGSSQDPFVVSADLGFGVADNTVFNLTLSGSGTVASPWSLSVAFAATAKLDDIPDVNAPAPTNGQVLSWNSGTSRWVPANPTTAPTGAVTTDSSLDGDGSVGSPLEVKEDPAGFLVTSVDGLALSDQGINRQIRKFVDAVDRASADPVPELNTLSMLDDEPGQVYYWDGTDWVNVHQNFPSSGHIEGTSLLELSGPYVEGVSLLHAMVMEIDVTTDSNGEFEVFGSVHLADHGGVVFCQVQETGAVPYKAMVWPDTNRIAATAYRLDTGAPYASQAITGTAFAWAY